MAHIEVGENEFSSEQFLKYVFFLPKSNLKRSSQGAQIIYVSYFMQYCKVPLAKVVLSTFKFSTMSLPLIIMERSMGHRSAQTAEEEKRHI